MSPYAAFAAVAATAENQRIEVNRSDNAKASTPRRLIWVDPDGPGEEDGKCVTENPVLEMDCRILNVDELVQQMNETLDKLPGGAVGEVGDGERTLHAVLTNVGAGTGTYARNEIRLPRDWKTRSPKGAVHHETGHAFVDKYLQPQVCDGSVGSPCTKSIVEERGVDEGIAKILQTSVGGGEVEDPPAVSVDAIFEDHCGTLGSISEGRQCAHHIGNLVHDMYEELAKHKGESYARDRYAHAVVALGNVSSVSVADLHLQVGREIAELEGVQFPVDEAAALTEGDFSLADLRRLLELLGVRRIERDIRPEYIPH